MENFIVSNSGYSFICHPCIRGRVCPSAGRTKSPGAVGWSLRASDIHSTVVQSSEGSKPRVYGIPAELTLKQGRTRTTVFCLPLTGDLTHLHYLVAVSALSSETQSWCRWGSAFSDLKHLSSLDPLADNVGVLAMLHPNSVLHRLPLSRKLASETWGWDVSYLGVRSGDRASWGAWDWQQCRTPIWRKESCCPQAPANTEHPPSALQTLLEYFVLKKGVPAANGSSQARGRIRATAIATWGPSCICNLPHSSRQHQILNSLSKTRDQICILMDASRVCYRWTTMGTPRATIGTPPRHFWGPEMMTCGGRSAFPQEWGCRSLRSSPGAWHDEKNSALVNICKILV